MLDPDPEITLARDRIGRRLATYGIDGRFTLGTAGEERLQTGLDPPAYRVVVGEESESFVRECHNAFARFVRGADSEIRPGDETLVVNEGDSLLAVGQAKIDSAAMADFHRGIAVRVPDGVDE